MQATTGTWVQFEIAGERYALPVEAVAEIVGLADLQPAGHLGWAGRLAYRDGAVPLAEGAGLVGPDPTYAARGRGLVLRGRLALGFTVDAVDGPRDGTAYPLVSRIGLPELAVAALPAADGTAVVLDADRLWRHLLTGLKPEPDGRGCRLRRLAPSAELREPPTSGLSTRAPESPFTHRDGEEAVIQPPAESVASPQSTAPAEAPVGRETPVAAATFPGGRVLVFRVGLEADLAVPLEHVLEIGPTRQARPLRGGPRHLAGLLDWRGRLVPFVDLPAQLGSAVPEPRQTLYLALTGRAAQAIAVSVGEVVGPAQVPPAGPTGSGFGIPEPWVRGVARLDERVLIVVDPAALMVA